MEILFACAIITSTACAISVSPSSYRNTIFNQSVHVFSLDWFLKRFITRKLVKLAKCKICAT